MLGFELVVAREVSEAVLTRMEMTGMGASEAAETVDWSTTAPKASVKAASAARSSGGLKKTGKGDPPKAEPFISTVSCHTKSQLVRHRCPHRHNQLGRALFT